MPEALLQKIEAPFDRQRRRSENDRFERLEQALAQQGAHVDRRGRDEHALVAAFEPVDEVPFARFEQEFQFAAQLHPAARDVQQFLGLCGERGDFRFQAFQRVHQGVVGLAVLFEESRALRLVERKAALARRERLEKTARPLAHPRDLLLQRRAAGLA